MTLCLQSLIIVQYKCNSVYLFKVFTVSFALLPLLYLLYFFLYLVTVKTLASVIENQLGKRNCWCRPGKICCALLVWLNWQWMSQWLHTSIPAWLAENTSYICPRDAESHIYICITGKICRKRFVFLSDYLCAFLTFNDMLLNIQMSLERLKIDFAHFSSSVDVQNWPAHLLYGIVFPCEKQNNKTGKFSTV